MDSAPQIDFDDVGGLSEAKDELLTYACAATNPGFYTRWGTFPPSGLLLIGRRGVGKSLLARALASRAGTAFLGISVPRLVLEVLHTGGKMGDLLTEWGQTLEEAPPVTVFFDELEFDQAQDLGTQRTDLPVGQIMDFLLDLVDRTIAVEGTLVVASTAAPDTLRPAFVLPGRFERVVEVTAVIPDDVVAALTIHAAAAEARAGHSLFEDVNWIEVVKRYTEPSIGDWVRILHGALRRKARCEAAGETVTPVQTKDLLAEVDRIRQAYTHMRPVGGTYL
jgi:ATP-dependent 26S proteasome regulatory subunit